MRTHAARKRKLPCWRVLPGTEELLALVVCPEAAHGVGHLAHPRPGDAVKQAAGACRVVHSSANSRLKKTGSGKRAPADL